MITLTDRSNEVSCHDINFEIQLPCSGVIQRSLNLPEKIGEGK